MAKKKKERLRKIKNTFKKESIFSAYKKSFFIDLIAGITVALVMIPQSMAYAGLAGLPMQMGLYTALAGLLLASVFGSSKQMISGPVTIVSIMTGAAIVSLGASGSDEAIVYAQVLALIVGVFYIILRVAKLGVIVEFLSHPVILGFTNAIALVTIFSQLGKIFGVTAPEASNYFHELYLLFTEIVLHFHIPTLIFGLSALVFLVLAKRFAPRFPRVLLLIVISTLISAYYPSLTPHVGFIPSGLPQLGLSVFEISVSELLQLLPFGIMIAIIGFTESISVAKIVSIKTKKKINSNQEIIGQSVANIASSMIGGYPVAGSFSRTAVNLKNNAQTELASIFAGLIVAVVLIFFTDLLFYIPIATLAAIIIVAVAGLIRFRPIFEAYKIQKVDGYIAWITFFLTLLLTPQVEIAVGIGVLLSLFAYIYKSMRPKIVEVSYYKTGVLRNADFFQLRTSKDIAFYKVDGSLFFGNSSYFERVILNMIAEKPEIKVVVFDFEWMPNIDSSAFSMFQDLVHKLKSEKIRVYMCGLRTKVIYKFDKVGYLKKFPRDHIFEKTDNVIKYLKKNYEKDELDLTPLLEYTPIDKKLTKESEKIMKKISHTT